MKNKPVTGDGDRLLVIA